MLANFDYVDFFHVLETILILLSYLKHFHRALKALCVP